MKKYEGVVVTVSSNPKCPVDHLWPMEKVVDRWELFLAERFGVSIENVGGKEMPGIYQLEDYPVTFSKNRENFQQLKIDIEDAWKEFCELGY